MKHHHPVLVALRLAHDDGVPVEIDILDAQAKAFHQAHARAIEQAGQQAHFALEQRQDSGHFVPRQDRRNPAPAGRTPDVVHPRQLHGQHLAVQKEKGAECLVVCGRRDLALGGEHREEGLNFRHAHVARMAQTMPPDEEAHPIQVDLLGGEAIVQIARTLSYLVHEAQGLEGRPTGFYTNIYTCTKQQYSRGKARLQAAQGGCPWLG